MKRKHELVSLTNYEAEQLLKRGSCPSNNTKCTYLCKGVCIKQEPSLARYKARIVCGDTETDTPVI